MTVISLIMAQCDARMLFKMFLLKTGRTYMQYNQYLCLTSMNMSLSFLSWIRSGGLSFFGICFFQSHLSPWMSQLIGKPPLWHWKFQLEAHPLMLHHSPLLQLSGLISCLHFPQVQLWWSSTSSSWLSITLLRLQLAAESRIEFQHFFFFNLKDLNT